MTFVDFYQSVIHAIWVNNTKKPFDDPRVRRAMHLALDKQPGGGGERGDPHAGGRVYLSLLRVCYACGRDVQTPGLSDRTKAGMQEARRLLAEAGYRKGIKGVDFMVRELAHHKLWSVAIQAMLKETLNIESNLRTVQTSVWFDEAQAGKYDLTISAIVSTLLDPSDYFNSWYAKDGPQNYSKWHNQAFEALAQAD